MENKNNMFFTEKIGEDTFVSMDTHDYLDFLWLRLKYFVIFILILFGIYIVYDFIYYPTTDKYQQEIVRKQNMEKEKNIKSY